MQLSTTRQVEMAYGTPLMVTTTSTVHTQRLPAQNTMSTADRGQPSASPVVTESATHIDLGGEVCTCPANRVLQNSDLFELVLLAGSRFDMRTLARIARVCSLWNTVATTSERVILAAARNSEPMTTTQFRAVFFLPLPRALSYPFQNRRRRSDCAAYRLFGTDAMQRVVASTGADGGVAGLCKRRAESRARQPKRYDAAYTEQYMLPSTVPFITSLPTNPYPWNPPEDLVLKRQRLLSPPGSVYNGLANRAVTANLRIW